MTEFKEFLSTAKSLSTAPLGIVALFQVLVYAIACLAIGSGNCSFIENPWHPWVLFLAIFPLAVLVLFFILVAWHHEKLYPPNAFKDQSHFLQTFQLNKAPSEIVSSRTDITTTGDNSRLRLEDRVLKSINEEYSIFIKNGFYLMHQCNVLRARMSPKSGNYVIRVWVESIENKRPLSDISYVTYRVWDDFKKQYESTDNVTSNFDLWLSAEGEFPILARIQLKNGDNFLLHRHLDLPGRPIEPDADYPNVDWPNATIANQEGGS